MSNTSAKRQFWPVAYRILATGTLVVYTAIGCKQVAFAQTAAAGVFGAEPQASAQPLHPARRFDIPTGLLEESIASFRAATGIEVEVANDAILTVQTPGIAGVFTPEEALRRLLEGTRVSFRFTAPSAVRLEFQRQTASVDVTDRIAPMSSPKYVQPMLDTPQTISIVSRAVIEQQGANTLSDVLRNVPGLTMTAGEGGVPAGDNMTLRGFSARNDVFVDGVRDLSPQSRDPFNLEQVEVVKGPSSAFAGRGSAGGTINIVSKGPNLARSFGTLVNFGSDGTKRLAADVNTPVRFLGERTAFRANALVHESGVAGRNEVKAKRWGLAPSLAFGLGTPVRVTLSYYKLKQDNLPDYGIPWVPNTNNVLAGYRDKPAPVSRENFYGLVGFNFERLNQDTGTVRFEYDFSDSANVRSQLRYGRSTRDSITGAPRFASNDTLVINRNNPSWITVDNIWDSQTDFQGRFRAGATQHAAVAGALFTNENNTRKARTIAGAPQTTLFNPDAFQTFQGTITPNPLIGDVTGNTRAVYAFDNVSFSDKLHLGGGIRLEQFAVNGVNTAGAPVVRTDNMLSGRGNIVFKPRRNASVYASAGNSLSPSLEGLSYGVANTMIAPEKTYTVEAGTKWELAGDRLLLSGALFRVNKTNARTPGLTPDEPPQVLQGNQRVQGVELGVTGNINRNFTLFGGYTLMDARILSSNTPAEVGRRIQNAPRNSYSLWATYTFRRLTVGGGPRFIGKRYGNNINTRWVENYWTADAMASFLVNRHLDLRFNAYNLNNAYNFDRLGGGHLIPNAARWVQGGVNARF